MQPFLPFTLGVMNAVRIHYALVGIVYNMGIPLSLVLDIIYCISCLLLVFNQLVKSASYKLCEHVILLSYSDIYNYSVYLRFMQLLLTRKNCVHVIDSYSKKDSNVSMDLTACYSLIQTSKLCAYRLFA